MYSAGFARETLIVATSQLFTRTVVERHKRRRQLRRLTDDRRGRLENPFGSDIADEKLQVHTQAPHQNPNGSTYDAAIGSKGPVFPRF
jgi:hypothetical protein